MRIYIIIGCISLLGPISQQKVSGNLYNEDDRDLYLDDYGSGDGPTDMEVSGFSHTEHEGSGHGYSRTGPYGATYDSYDDTEDDDDDVDIYNNYDDERDFAVEGSGSRSGGPMFIDEIEGPDTDLFKPSDKEPETEVEEKIAVDHRPKVESAPPSTTPPPTLTDDSEMDSSIQIHTTKTDDRQVSIFAQPGILAAFIGGAVVGLLCAILLVMFIVYRMRKKDEGSYPLDEPKRMPLTSSYSPNDKEIYA